MTVEEEAWGRRLAWDLDRRLAQLGRDLGLPASASADAIRKAVRAEARRTLKPEEVADWRRRVDEFDDAKVALIARQWGIPMDRVRPLFHGAIDDIEKMVARHKSGRRPLQPDPVRYIYLQAAARVYARGRIPTYDLIAAEIAHDPTRPPTHPDTVRDWVKRFDLPEPQEIPPPDT
jgi:hypothetical protein